MIDTIVLEYRQKLGKVMYHEHAEGKMWHKEKAERKQARQELDELQQYMVSKGFQIFNDKVIDASGGVHEIKC